MKFPVVTLLLLPIGVFALTKVPPSSSAHTKAAAHKVSPAANGKTSAPRKASGVRSKRSHYAAKRKPAGPSYQTHPTPERYKEIQQSLADKGYYKGEVNGEWNDDSTEALKKFQADHQLYDDGKISSLSLIRLGLGPKHDGGAVTSPVPLNPESPVPTVTEEPIDSRAVAP